MKPWIAVPCRRDPPFTGSVPSLVVRESYVQSLIAAGAVPVPIVFGLDEESQLALFERCSGVLFTGGEDVSPERYGEPPHPRLGAVDSQRDELEIGLCRQAVKQRKPVLGICRGMQLINVALGGTLWQDIPSQWDGAIAHQLLSEEQNPLTREMHRIQIKPGCRLAAVLGCLEIGANSSHHQSVKTMAPGLEAIAHAPDGIIEALEGEGVLAVQSHPETFWQGSEPRWFTLFEHFVRAAEKRATSA